LLSERKEFARQFVINNKNSITALAAAESLDPSSDLKLYVDLDKALIELYPDLSYVKSFHARVSQLSKLAIGSEAPQIVLPDTLGNPLELSSFRGKVVLVDFWASWCKPCRFENPNVVRLYEKYKDKGFEIYGVSLDKTKPAWMKAIKQDGLKWPQVSDLGFWNSAAVKLYSIESIPQTYLLDEQGVIIGKGLRGKALEDKIMQVLDAS
jgi:peroxiredoxin